MTKSIDYDWFERPSQPPPLTVAVEMEEVKVPISMSDWNAHGLLRALEDFYAGLPDGDKAYIDELITKGAASQQMNLFDSNLPLRLLLSIPGLVVQSTFLGPQRHLYVALCVDGDANAELKHFVLPDEIDGTTMLSAWLGYKIANLKFAFKEDCTISSLFERGNRVPSLILIF